MAAPRPRQELKLTNNEPLACNVCDRVDTEEYKGKKHDFLICINPSCNKHHEVMCRECMEFSHRKKPHHNLERDPSNFMNIREKKICTKCQILYSPSNPDSNRLFVCIKPQCIHQNHIMCAICMAQTHNHLDHTVANHTKYFVRLEQWYNLLRMKKVKPHGWGMTIIKAATKREFYGAAGAVAAIDAAGWSIIQAIPKNASYAQWTDGVIAAIKVNKSSAGLLMKNMAKSQAFVNGLMFAAECGWYAVDYAFFGNGTWNDMVVNCQKAAKAHTCAFGCSMIGAGIGFALGGPLGASVGASLGGLIGDFGSRKYMNAGDAKEYNKKKKNIERALRTFDYKGSMENVLQNKKKFNINELKRRYHLKAAWNHPDILRNQGGYTEQEIKMKWSEFYSKYVILLDLCKQRK